MLQEKVETLLDTLKASSHDIAEAAGTTTSTISRLKSGARTPRPDSPTIDKLILGAIRHASKNGMNDNLIELTEAEDKKHLDTALLSWLYSDDPMYKTKENKASGLPFSKKLDLVMNLLDITNVTLAKTANIDASYISRFRSGKRSPGSNPILLERLCMSLFDKAVYSGRLFELCDLIGIPKGSVKITKREELFLQFHAWMTDFNISDRIAVGHLLGSINAFSPRLDVTIPPLSSIISEDELLDETKEYLGLDGMRKAVLRFLGTTARDQYSELLLYSDQGMEWMLEDDEFKLRWAYLMALCVKQGTRIKIIHNIDRDVKEMLAAIESWLPLYVTGMLESYYHQQSGGNRFNHTIFLAPGKACIAACHTVGMEDKGIYAYYTDSLYIGFFEENFKQLMKNSGRLATFLCNMTEGATIDKDDMISNSDHDNLTISLSRNKVTVTKKTTPTISVSFTHPLMVNAFKTYIESL